MVQNRFPLKGDAARAYEAHKVPAIFEHRHRLARRSRIINRSPPRPPSTPPGFADFDKAMEQETERLRRMHPNGFQQNGRVRRHWIEKDRLSWFRVEAIDPHAHFATTPQGEPCALRPEFAETLRKFGILETLVGRYHPKSA